MEKIIIFSILISFFISVIIFRLWKLFERKVFIKLDIKNITKRIAEMSTTLTSLGYAAIDAGEAIKRLDKLFDEINKHHE